MTKVYVVMDYWTVLEFETDKSYEYLEKWAKEMLKSSHIDRVEIEHDEQSAVFVSED